MSSFDIFDPDGSVRAEEDLNKLLEIVEYWSARVSTAIDRFESYRRRLRIFMLVGATGTALGALAGSLVLPRMQVFENFENFANWSLLLLFLLSSVVSFAFVIAMIYNETRNVGVARSEIADTFYVFKEVQQMLASASDVNSPNQRYRSRADIHGRLMMMNYIERKAKRYVR